MLNVFDLGMSSKRFMKNTAKENRFFKLSILDEKSCFISKKGSQFFYLAD